MTGKLHWSWCPQPSRKSLESLPTSGVLVIWDSNDITPAAFDKKNCPRKLRSKVTIFINCYIYATFMRQNFNGFFLVLLLFVFFYNFLRNFPNIRIYLCPMGLVNAWIRDGIEPMPGTRIQSGIISFRYSNFSNYKPVRLRQWWSINPNFVKQDKLEIIHYKKF